MKENLRRLQLIGKVLDLSLFYVLNIYADHISFQGRYNAKLTIKLLTLKFTQSVTQSGYVEFNRGKITITLTD